MTGRTNQVECSRVKSGAHSKSNPAAFLNSTTKHEGKPECSENLK